MTTLDDPVVGSGAVATWYRDHFDGLARMAYLATGDLAHAEDAVQEVFAELCRRPREIRGPSPLPYLRAAVLNRCRSRHRRRVRGEALQLRLVEPGRTGDGDVEDAAVAATDARHVVDAVRRLPRRQRDVVILRYWVGLSESEIAATLGVSTGTVKSQSSRARATLSTLLEALR